MIRTYVEANYPKENITYYDTFDECIQAIRKNKQDVTYINQYLASSTVLNDAKNQLSYSTYVAFKQDITIGINDNVNPLLISILQKTLNSFGMDYFSDVIGKESEMIVRNNTFVSLLYDNPYMFIGLVSFIFIFIALIAILFIRKDRLKITKQHMNELTGFVDFICTGTHEVGEINVDTKERYKFHVENNELKKTKLDDYEFKSELFYIHPEDINIASKYFNYRFLEELVEKQERVRFECRANLDGNEYIWYSYTFLGRRNESINKNSIIYIRQNIDQIRRVEQEEKQLLTQALEMAEAGSKAKTVFTSRISHEMRTPLNAIVGYMHIAQDTVDDPVKTQEYLKKSQVAAKQLMNIINDVLDMSSITSGKVRLNLEKCYLKTIINEINDIFYNQTKENGINYIVKGTNLINEGIIGDSLRIKQILINLLSNAVKFTPTGGTITFSINQSKVIKNNSNYQFIISDTGIGMTEEFKKRMFQPYEQQDTTTKQVYGGTGLGLSITKQLIQMMNGQIEVKSQEGKGTTFIITIPFETLIDNKKVLSKDVYAYGVHAINASNNPEVVENVTGLLKKCHFDCDNVKTGIELITKLKASVEEGNPYQLVIVDWEIEKKGCFELITRIKKIISNISIIITITNQNPADIEDKAKKAGASIVIDRPIFYSTMYNILMDSFGKNINQTLINKEYSFDFKNKKVLLVEDNKFNCEIMTLLLNKVNCEVVVAYNGAEAIKLFKESQENEYALILMDIIMPLMNGLEATQIMRKLERKDAKTIPIIALTANAFPEDVNKSIKAGMNDHIFKPVDPENLFTTMYRYIFDVKGLDPKEVLNKAHILLVEDNKMNEIVATKLLEKKKIIIDIAENGKIAVDKFNQSAIGYYDAILMDIRMPVMDGIEATKLIRISKRKDASLIPIIAMTADAFVEDKQRTIEAGMNDYMSKPIIPNDLYDILQKEIIKYKRIK